MVKYSQFIKVSWLQTEWPSITSFPERFLMLRKPLVVRLCVVVCVLLRIFSIFCMTSFGDYTRQQHQETTRFHINTADKSFVFSLFVCNATWNLGINYKVTILTLCWMGLNSLICLAYTHALSSYRKKKYFGASHDVSSTCRTWLNFQTLHGRAETRSFSSSVKQYFKSERSERVKYFATREEKFRISKESCNVLSVI